MDISALLLKLAKGNGLVFAFLCIAIVMWVASLLSKATNKRIAGSAIAIFMALVIAGVVPYLAGVPGKKGIADVTLFAGIGTMGGAMFRDFAIVSTAFGAKLEEIKKGGLAGIVALLVGIIGAYIIGVIIARIFGYTSSVDMATIGAGAVTFVVGPVTGAAVGASSDVIALAIAAGVVKSILVMIATPLMARFCGLNNPQSAIVYGGLMGTTSGTAAGLAATDPALVPYGAMGATFYTGLGCLLCPSVLYIATKAIFG